MARALASCCDRLARLPPCLLGASALLVLLAVAGSLRPAPARLLLGRANSSACLSWLEPCAKWEVCAARHGNASKSPPPAGWAATACPAAARPLRHVLVVHEQHPQELGCDRRLLAIMQLLQAQGLRVSLLYRKHVPASMQSPSSAALAALLGVVGFDESELLQGSCLRPPPALYHYAGPEQLRALAARGWFDVVLVTVWFWNDPRPSFAEVTLPPLRSHAPAGGQPFVALLVDDAHALRAARLAEWEAHAPSRRAYLEQASSLRPRQASLYALADGVAHVSAEDSAAERASFPSAAAAFSLLRTPLRSMQLGAGAGAPRAFGRTRHVGFLGNGQTATNHQAITWFLQHCWPSLRAAQPTLRLRLLGRPPG